MARAVSRVSGHPFLRDKPKGHWYPEAVGVVPGYPKTYESWKAKSDTMRQQVALYNAEGITGRSGVKDGWAGKKSLINQINAAAAAEAKDIVDRLIEEKRFEPDNREARIALEAAVAVIAAEKHTPEQAAVPLYDVKERLAAAKIVLEYTQKKPVVASDISVKKAEDFLAAALAD